MATSSITEPFYCEDPKAVNVLIHALFTEPKPSNRRSAVRFAEFASHKDEVSFIRKMQNPVGRAPRDRRGRHGVPTLPAKREVLQLPHAFEKKTRKTPHSEIKRALAIKRELLGGAA